MTKLLQTSWVALAVLALGMIAGCQTGTDKGGPSASGGGTPADGKKFKVGVSIPAAEHGWTAGIKWWADTAAKANPDIEWIIDDAKEPSEQISDLENMQTQGVDAVVVLATESAPITPIAEKLHQAGILVINVDRGFTKPVADVFIEGDNRAFGRKAAEFIVQKLGGQGKIAILEGIPSTVNTDRVSAAMEVFRQNPGIQIVGQGAGEWNRQKSEEVMASILTANPQLDAVWAADDDMALGAETAMKAAGRTGIWMVGGGGMKDVVKRVMDKDPLFPATVTYPPSMIAFGMQTAAGMLRTGEDLAKGFTPRRIVMDVTLVTPENAKDFYFPDSVY